MLRVQTTFLRLLGTLALTLAVNSARANGNNCNEDLEVFLSQAEPVLSANSVRTPIRWTPANRVRATDIMLAGSLNVSRTKVNGLRNLAPDAVADHEIANLAEKNFREAIDYVFANLHDLEIDGATAIQLNKILTRDLVPENIRGQLDYRIGGAWIDRTDDFVDGRPAKFYQWLKTPEAKDLAERDPVRLAEIIHNNVAALDSFPDGNGRLSRLFADLVLLKRGMAPAFYTDMQRYFDVGNARARVRRGVRVDYFREIVERGERAMREHKPLGKSTAPLAFVTAA